MNFIDKLAQNSKMALRRRPTSANHGGVENRETIPRSYSKLVLLGKRTLRKGEAIEKKGLFKRKVIFGSNKDRRIYLCLSKIKFLRTIETGLDDQLWIKEKDGPVWVYPRGAKVAYDPTFIEDYKVKPSSTIDYEPMSSSPLNRVTSNLQPICKYSLKFVDDVSTIANEETDPDLGFEVSSIPKPSFLKSRADTFGSNLATIAPSQAQIQQNDSSENPFNTVPTPLVWAVVRDVSRFIFSINQPTAIVLASAATGVKLLGQLWHNDDHQHHEESSESQRFDNIPLEVEIPFIVSIRYKTITSRRSRRNI